MQVFSSGLMSSTQLCSSAFRHYRQQALDDCRHGVHGRLVVGEVCISRQGAVERCGPEGATDDGAATFHYGYIFDGYIFGGRGMARRVCDTVSIYGMFLACNHQLKLIRSQQDRAFSSIGRAHA